MFQKVINLSAFLFFISVVLYSCIDDDVCDEVTTPRLTITFVDSLGQTLQKDSLYIDKLNTDSTKTQYIFSSVDSVKVPLNAFSDQTVLYLYDTINTPDSIKNVVTIKYTTEQQFASRACGLKILFNNVTYEATLLNNIKSITGQTNQIHDETSTNLRITY